MCVKVWLARLVYDSYAYYLSYLSSLETYWEYKKVKSHLSGEGSAEKKMKRVHFEDDIECQRSPPPTNSKEDGVFGLALNKNPKKKVNGDFYIGGRREEERKSVWKLHRWSKSHGHHTVVVKEEGDGEEEEGRDDEGERATEKKDQDMTGSTTNMEEKANEVCVAPGTCTTSMNLAIL